MNPKSRNRIALVAALALQILALLALSGCSERDLAGLELATAPVNPVVYADAFLGGLDYAAFEWSFYEAFSEDNTVFYAGSQSLKIAIPAGEWAGGSFYTHEPRDFSSFNALTFWAKASQALNLGSCGFGIGINWDPDYQTEVTNTPLTTEWRQVIIPIPNPERMTSEHGMFWYSHGTGGVDIWFDEVKYATVGGVTNPRPVMASESVEALLDESVPITGTKTTYSVNGEDIEVVHTAAHFNYISSNEEVVVAENGVVTAVGGGTATITATLGGVDVDGEVTVTVIAPPSTPAPAPTENEADVIPLFSDAYSNNITVDTWRTDWSSQSVAVFDQDIMGDNVKAYVGLNNLAYVGIEFIAEQIDAATPGMTHFHLDVFAPVGSMLLIKLVDFGPNGVYDGPGSDDSEAPVTLHGGSTPAFVPGEWVSLDIPLSSFAGMNFEHVSQLIMQSTNIGNIWVDNIYFHK